MLRVRHKPCLHQQQHRLPSLLLIYQISSFVSPPQSAPVAMQVSEGQQVQIVQAAAAQGQAQTAQAQGQTMQVMQQIITNTGEIQQIPVRDGIMVEMKHSK